MALPKLQTRWKESYDRGNLSSHLTNNVIQACQDHNIAFIFLFPNATDLLQPLDVTYYASLQGLIWKIRAASDTGQKGHFPYKKGSTSFTILYSNLC